MEPDHFSMATVNHLSEAAFGDRFGGVFERSPSFAKRAYPSRPWSSLADLHAAMCAAVRAASSEEQLALIRAHPDLVGRAALAGTLTRESTVEQRAAGLDPGALSPDEVARFADGNAAYRAKFGFPFVICARDNQKQAILAGLAARLENDHGRELTTALGEIERIAWHRLVDLVVEP